MSSSHHFNTKRQKTSNGGYQPTNNGYNSDADEGDDLLADYIPDTPTNTRYETQPTQILDRPLQPQSSPPYPQSAVQVPASSPLQGSVDSPPIPRVKSAFVPSPGKPLSNVTSPYTGSVHSPSAPVLGRPFQQPQFAPASSKPWSNPTTSKFASPISMAPPGTTFRPPPTTTIKHAPTHISLLDDDGPTYKGGSSDDDDNDRANIKPSTFLPRSALTNGMSVPGYPKFQELVSPFAYNPSMGGATGQSKPERAKPIDITMDSIPSQHVRGQISSIRAALPHVTILQARDALMRNRQSSVDDAVEFLSKFAQPAIYISDNDKSSASPAKKPQPEMKRGLNAPIHSIKDRYTSTQLPRQADFTPPPKPKGKLMRGRRNASSPAPPTQISPQKPSSPVISIHDYDSDSGVASASEEDPELGGRVLKYLNTCTVSELIELTNITPANADIMVAARPFGSLDIARTVANPAVLKGGKKSTRAPIGDKIVDTAMDMFSGYEAIDQLVSTCEKLGKPLAEEMGKWGFDVFGAAKDGELEMTSLEDETESQRDSGIGSPTSRGVSVNGDAGDDDVKVVSSTRKKSGVNFLKKPTMMADDCILKDYQIVGLNWLALMYRHKLSGILADEMGLGKTCQVIALLSHLIETGHPGPHLIVVPGSTLENWLREFPKFSPGIVVEPYYGLQKERPAMAESILARRDQINVIVTTYDLASKKEDSKFMKRLDSDVVVYDEGHYLKNLNSQRYQGLVKIPAKFKLLLTGTPLQNNLQELAALLAFILPGIFKERQEDLSYIFKAKATTRDADHAALLSAQRIARARSMLTPFVLRRKKAQVLKHLPEKTCRVEYCSLHPAQKVIYNGHIEQARERAKLRVEGGRVPKSDENNPLMQLRKASIHPLLFRRHFTDAKIEKMADILRKKEPVNFPSSSKREHLINEMKAGSDFWLHNWCLDYPCISSYDIPDLAWLDSGKVEAMVKLVKAYKENGDRVLIFSQFSMMLDILEAVLNSSLISFTRIDGGTKIDERQSLIDTFRDDETITAFLLTTKAGGTGINLMYANKVIIFDGSFNPQDDRQAENRAHRVGQTRNVEVVRLVTRNTVEEQIYALGQSKLVLDGRVAGDDDAAGEEAGEKAVSKMMLEGTWMSEDSVAAAETADTKTEQVTEEVTGKRGSQRKKSTILDLVTKKGTKAAKILIE